MIYCSLVSLHVIFLPDFFFPLSYVLIEPISVLFDGKFNVVVNADPNGPGAARLILRVVELADLGMFECLKDSDPLFRVEEQQLFHEVKCLRCGLGEDLTHGSLVGRRQRL